MKFRNMFDPQIARTAECIDIIHDPNELQGRTALRIEVVNDGHDFCYDFRLDATLETRVDVTIDQVPIARNLPVQLKTRTFFAALNEAQFELTRVKRDDTNRAARALHEELFEPQSQGTKE